MADISHRVVAWKGVHSYFLNRILPSNRYIRFLIAGVCNTIFGLAVYSILIVAGLEVWASLLLGTIAGIVFNFLTVGGYVFQELTLVKLPKFIICYLSVYSVNLSLIEFFSRWINSEVLVQVVLILPMAILSYTLLRYFVFTMTTK